jgi:hypothetical protein
MPARLRTGCNRRGRRGEATERRRGAGTERRRGGGRSEDQRRLAGARRNRGRSPVAGGHGRLVASSTSHSEPATPAGAAPGGSAIGGLPLSASSDGQLRCWVQALERPADGHAAGRVPQPPGCGRNRRSPFLRRPSCALAPGQIYLRAASDWPNRPAGAGAVDHRRRNPPLPPRCQTRGHGGRPALSCPCLVGRFHAHVHFRVTPRAEAVRSVPGETRQDN